MIYFKAKIQRMLFVNLKIFENYLIRYGLYGMWGLCIIEMTGIIKTNIHTIIGNLLIVLIGCYNIYQEIYGYEGGKGNEEDKAKTFNNLLLAFSNEIKKAVEDSQQHTDETEIDEEPVVMYSAEYFKEQMELIEQSLKSVEEIDKKIKNINESVDCAHDYQCMKCQNYLDTTLPCNDGDHWFKCNRCDIIENDYGKMLIDNTNSYILGNVQHTDTDTERGRKRTRSSQMHSSSYHESLSRSRSRSRDKEGDPDCDHNMVRFVAGYDDKYDKCTKCGYEFCR